MNDLMLGGLVFVGTLLLAGGGSWVMSVINRNKNSPKT